MELFNKYVRNPKVFVYLASACVLWIGKRYFNGPWTPVKKSMENKTIIITGCNTGIGLKTAEDLLSQGAFVVFACRDEKRAQQAIETLPSDSQKRAKFMKLDLCDFNSVNLFAQEFRKFNKSIDILINNAGSLNSEFQLTKDGLELTIQSNHFGHKVLTLLLFDKMNKNEARIINVSSRGYALTTESEFKKLIANTEFKTDFNYDTKITYFNSKLAKVFFTQYLAEICENNYPNIKTVCLHPGTIITEIGRNLSWYVKIMGFLLYPFLWNGLKSQSAVLKLHYIYVMKILKK